MSITADGAVTVVEHQLVRALENHPPIPKPARAPQVRRAVPAVSYSPGSIEGIIAAAANRWGVSASWMISIARCESGLRPTAYNPSGPYYGLFQFLMSTFRANGGTNIWSPVDQANITAKMLAHGQAWQWSCA
jgi:resuscitation-promoting factor RpfB